jgi:hypothetical protein
MHNNKPKIIPFERIVTVHDISELIVIKRTDNIDLKKLVLTVETDDGQVFYPELRYSKIELIKKLNINIKDKVKLTFSFQGSEKNGKKYNNIYIKDIKKE